MAGFAMAEDKTPEYLLKPWQVFHSNGNVVSGFNELQDAEEDAEVRNVRARKLGLSCQYVAGPNRKRHRKSN